MLMKGQSEWERQGVDGVNGVDGGDGGAGGDGGDGGAGSREAPWIELCEWTVEDICGGWQNDRISVTETKIACLRNKQW